MSKTILHIGYPKTATKWFLGNFYPYVKNAGIIYNENLYYNVTPEKEYFEVRPDERFVERELKIIATHALSGFVDGHWRKGIYRPFFLKHLKETFPNAEVIIFIRNQLEFIPSMYSSYLKRGGTERINKIFDISDSNKGDVFSFEFLNYAEVLIQFQEKFGKDNVHVFLYEDFLKNNKDFLLNFANVFGLDITIDELATEKTNEKLRIGLARTLRLTNQLVSKGLQPKKSIANFPWVYSLLNDRIDTLNKYVFFGKKIPGEKIMGLELIEYVNEYYKNSNKKLVDEFGLEDIKNYGYPL